MENYDFLSKIAEGAYGTVWRCVEKTTGRVVAVKKLKDPTAAGTEARALICWRAQRCAG